MKTKNPSIPIKMLMLIITFALCLTNNVVYGGSLPAESDKIAAIDYDDADNWAIISESPDKPVDVFLFMPTTYKGEDNISDINDDSMREGGMSWYAGNGSAFVTAGNIYMPFYRQANAMWVLAMPEAERAEFLANGPNKLDCIAAFEYYLEHYNNGKPFILAGHSQGASMTLEILFDYFVTHPEIAERMVAAYVIGYSVTTDDLARNPELKFAESADDTGVIISWNTIAPDADTTNLQVLLPNSVAINPISWTRSEKLAPAADNLGSLINGKKIMGLADARVDKNLGAVISNADKSFTMPEALSFAFGTGSFHAQDISFYYFNIRQNAENRVKEWLK